MRRIAAAALLVLAACGGGGDDDDDTAAESLRESTTSTTTAAAGEETTTSTSSVDAADGPSTTVAPASGSSPGSPGGAAAEPDVSTTPTPIAPGTYRYRQSGSAKVGTDTYEAPPEGTMVADAASGDGKQVFHRYVDPEGEPADSTMQFRADGMFILETIVRMGQTEITCTFDPPLAAPPWPATVGATSSGHGECGSFTTDVTSEITEARTVTLDGRTYDAVVVKSIITTSGQFESTTNQIDWFVPELRVSAHTEQDAKGRFGAFTFESTGTSDLLSAIPT